MTNSATSPHASGAAYASSMGAQMNTSPPAGFAASVDVAVASGISSKYWLELLAYPAGSARSLWLYVNNAWKSLDNPSASIQDAVQRAFLGSGSNVRVWYNNGGIVGLVVEGS